MSDDAVDVLIICALPEELDALREITDGVADGWTEVEDTPRYWTATLAGRAGPIRVAAARPTETAGIAAAELASCLSEKLGPRALAMCGVCAGHPDDTDLGDVVIADRVFQHDNGKLTPDGFKGDLRTHLPDDRWVYAAQELANKPAEGLHGYGPADRDDGPWWFLERLITDKDPQKSAFSRYFPDDRRVELLTLLRERGLVRFTKGRFSLAAKGRTAVLERRAIHGTRVDTRPYHVLVGPMGSGNYVAADGGVWARVAAMGERRIRAVEQEAGAIGAVAHRRRLPFLVAKGVMDHADKHKNDWAKPFAARASAEVLCAFLRRVIEPGPKTADPPSERSAKFEAPNRELRFTGRDEELTDLERLMTTNQSVCVVATGIGGIGKTTLVSEFVATRARELFPDGVAWIDGSPERFAGELARVSERFGWPTNERGRGPTPDEAVDWLKAEAKLVDKKMLIVVDNFDAKQSESKHVPVPGGDTRTIVTSRTRTLDEELRAARLMLGVWAPEVCRTYLRDNCRGDCPWVETTSDDDLDRLTDFVGRLPLGMRLLVSLLRRQSHVSPAELLPLLRQQPLGTLDQFDQERGVAATFRFAYETLAEDRRRVLQALAACASRTRVEIVGAVAAVADVATVGEALSYLRTHGFAELAEQGVWSLHDVVRMFLLAQPGAEEFERRQLGWVRGHLNEHADPTAHREFACGVEEAKHAFTRWLGRDTDAAEAVHRALLPHLVAVGRYADVVQLSESLLAAASPDSAEVAVGLGNLGLCYQALGNVPEAITCFERSLALHRKLDRLAGVASSLGNLGMCYQDLGDLQKAIEYAERSLAINLKLGRIEGVADCLGNLGTYLQALGKLSEAIKYLECSLAIDEKLGRLHGQASQLGNLGVCYANLGDLPKAVDHFERSFAIDTRLGRLHGQASQLANLGLSYQMLGDLPRSIEHLEHSFSICEQLDSLDGQATALGNLGLCYRKLGNIPKAIEYHERSLAIDEKLGRLEGQANQLANLGGCYAQLDQHPTAVGFLTRARELYRRMSLPADHPHLATVEEALAHLG